MSYERIDGVVYCHDHGYVHDDTTDPYRIGEDECRTSEHRPVYFRRRTGDIFTPTTPTPERDSS